MKNGPVFFIGIFAAVTLSWAGMVLAPNAQVGALTPYYDDTEGTSFPQQPSGIAAQGELVYRDLGCAACHTQQVRRPDFGADQARGWGDRQTVARDYIFEAHPQLGSLRVGPDLANLGGRKPSPPDRDDLLKLLYAGSPTHASYRFLFDERKIVGQRSDQALNLTEELTPPAGYEVVPSERAEALVSYLENLKIGYEYPEARPQQPEAQAPKPAASAQKAPNTEPSPETEKSNPAGKRPEQAVPAAAPDENKKQTK